MLSHIRKEFVISIFSEFAKTILKIVITNSKLVFDRS